MRDSGLLHALLGLATVRQLQGHPAAGSSWEGFVVEQTAAALPAGAQLGFYRTAAGAELDLVLEGPAGRIGIEIKSLTCTHQRGWILLARLNDDPAKQHLRIAGLPVLTVPSAAELADPVRSQRVRDIEPEDLLGRAPMQLDEAGIGATLRGKAVLITGAGGSIGSELCRQVVRFQPARLVLYELSEFNLYSIEQSAT